VPFQYAFTSMLVAGAGRDANHIAKHIADRVAERGRGPELTPAPVSR
jgi:hypothetical protein